MLDDLKKTKKGSYRCRRCSNTESAIVVFAALHEKKKSNRTGYRGKMIVCVSRAICETCAREFWEAVDSWSEGTRSSRTRNTSSK